MNVESGHIAVTREVNLYYEVRKHSNLTTSTEPVQRVIMIMGAFATLKHFEEQAEYIVMYYEKKNIPVHVLTYDHRGVGKSRKAGVSNYVKQSSSLLASDALTLLNHIWGDHCEVNVYGASLGGMVAQELASHLIQTKRLKSLYLAVTSRGSYLRPLGIVGPTAWAMLMPILIKSDRQRMVREVLVPASFSPETIKEQGERYACMWLEDYDAWWAFGDAKACACQASAAATHYWTNEKITQMLAYAARTKIPITVQIATKDKLMPVSKQHDLAKLLQANVVTFDQGHMGDDKVKVQLFEAYCSHLNDAFKLQW